MDNSTLYNWVFNFNPFTQNWRACKREDYNKLFSEPESNFLSAKDLNVLIELILKTNGNIDKINNLLNN